MDETTAPEAEQTAPAEPIAEPAASKPAKRSNRSRSVTKATSPKQKTAVCAGCGKAVELDTTTTVGVQAPIQHHGCENMQKRLHDWFIALQIDPDAPRPEITK